MRRAISTLFVVGLAIHAGAGFVDKNVRLVQDETKPDAPVPSTQSAPDTEVIKPKTDIDPKIEKTAPNPDPDPSDKDVIKPPSSIEPK
jgi:hypothetical protein